jgi:type VI secretion system protein ImpM
MGQPGGACGLFGKVPARRDFVAAGIPQSVLGPWESWLQREMAQSRVLIDRAWVAAFLKAPIWRFWCGSRVLGRAALGVLMPSVDGVGRYFPLTLLAVAPEGHGFPPVAALLEAPFLVALEDLALAALAPEARYEDLRAALDGLAPPLEPAPAAERRGVYVSAALGEGADARFADAAEALADWRAARSGAGHSVWWTLGGDGFAARMLAVEGLPDGALFATMLSGAFEAGAEAS